MVVVGEKGECKGVLEIARRMEHERGERWRVGRSMEEGGEGKSAGEGRGARRERKERRGSKGERVTKGEWTE